jgi:hypothetical protein
MEAAGCCVWGTFWGQNVRLLLKCGRKGLADKIGWLDVGKRDVKRNDSTLQTFEGRYSLWSRGQELNTVEDLNKRCPSRRSGRHFCTSSTNLEKCGKGMNYNYCFCILKVKYTSVCTSPLLSVPLSINCSSSFTRVYLCIPKLGFLFQL